MDIASSSISTPATPGASPEMLAESLLELTDKTQGRTQKGRQERQPQWTVFAKYLQ